VKRRQKLITAMLIGLLISTLFTTGCQSILVTRDGENPDIENGLRIGCGGAVITGSGNLKTKSYDVKDFTGIEAQNGFQVELTKSGNFSIEITTDDNVLECIEVYKSGNILVIKPQGQEIRTYRSVTFRAKITVPELHEIRLSGGSIANISGFNSSNDLDIGLSGGSRVDGDIIAGNADLDLSGGSRVLLEGRANDLVVSGSGGSQLDLEYFPVNSADIHLSGGGSAIVNLDGTLDVDLSGGSRVTYLGEPVMGDIDLSGDSIVKKK